MRIVLFYEFLLFNKKYANIFVNKKSLGVKKIKVFLYIFFGSKEFFLRETSEMRHS